MGKVTAFTDEPRCPRCHESVGPYDSYRGYCLGCLLTPALDEDDPTDEELNGRFDPYEVLTGPEGDLVELGRGSMGVTYLALDTTLQFSVALKVIDFKSAGLEANRERFLQEARAAAKLRHPHVASVLYYGVRPDGQCFYAMELVEGETLAERVQRSGALSVTDALEVIAQVASALEAAERYGLVHRDLKPANIMLVNGPKINAKVIDFGIAKIIGDQEPSDLVFVGTPAFASPEQFTGESIDQRSDFFSLGSTLFYLLTKDPPFKADRVSELPGQMLLPSVAIDRLKALGIPAPLRKLVGSLLSPDPANRPQNGPALIKVVFNCQRAMAAPKQRKPFWIGLALLALLVAAVSGFLLLGLLRHDDRKKSVAVLPFDNLTPMGDKAYFSDGVQDEILTELAAVADLQVMSRDSVQSYKNSTNRPSPSEIGRALHVNYLVNGSVEREADRIRVSVQLVEAQTGHEIWARRYDRELTDVFAIQAQIAETISQGLRAKLSLMEKASIEEAPTHDLNAYELYLQANELLLNYDETSQGWGPLESAARLLDEAVARDPNFALAWATLAKAHDYSYWYHADHTDSRRAAAESALQKALQLRPDLGQIHLAAGLHLMVTTRDYTAIRHELEIARRTLPNSAYLFDLLASVDRHQGQWLDALRDYEKESTLDPKNLELIINRCVLYEYHRQYDALRKIPEETLAPGSNAQVIDFEKALIAWQQTGDALALHALLDEPAGPMRAVARATLLKISLALQERDFAKAERILAADPRQEFEGGDRKFVCRDFVLGWIRRLAGNQEAAAIAYTNARPLQEAYVKKWPDDPNPLMMLALTDAALGRKDDARREAVKAVTMRPISKDGILGPELAADLAQVYLICGERELAIGQLESLEQVPGALVYGDLAKTPDWNPLRNDPRFQKLLTELRPIPIVNRSASE
jgi:serine/threonine protein kinase